ncbi:MAG: hypothetical protein ABIY63_02925 [Fibrobacteria bacterium]
MPTLGSLVQNGKFAASAPALVKALKIVDLPTFGKPTMPHLKPIANIPYLTEFNDFSLKSRKNTILSVRL